MAEHNKVDMKMVDHICDLAKLNLSESERKEFVEELNGTLEVFRQIDEVDTLSVEPSFHPTKIENVWREDVVEKRKWDPLANAKHKEGGFFKGPKIV
jgi:aspartyl-tRNA(Asn)/glutamyl-tRNA(Gln) amidotransferase subunit C